MLRGLVAHYCGVAAESVRFAYGPNGKPSIDGGPHFNLSHSGGIAVFAFCADAEIGVDVEAVREMTDAEAILSRTCPVEDVEHWRRSPRTDRDRIFFEIWTRREAWAKGIGLGLGMLDAEARPQGWSFWDASPCSGYVGALAAPGEGWQVRPMGQFGGVEPFPDHHSG